ncbi:MAG: hypothetical protein LUH51_00075 [Firmicutes bacterium]|nr:hypothetical protein [Bacillota bacterium]
MGVHDGHRKRLKARFQEEGLEHFDEINALELLLFYCIPRQDTNIIAHALLEQFGTFAAVLEASPSELKKVKGVGDSIAGFLPLVMQTSRYYQVCRMKHAEILPTVDKCGSYLVPYFIGRQNETVYLLCLDAKCKVLCCKEAGEGSVNSAAVPIRRIVQMALAANATSVVLAHNHPSGLALPSADDVQTTHALAAALKAVEISLADHIVIADDDYVSMVQSGLYHP